MRVWVACNERRIVQSADKKHARDRESIGENTRSHNVVAEETHHVGAASRRRDSVAVIVQSKSHCESC